MSVDYAIPCQSREIGIWIEAPLSILQLLSLFEKCDLCRSFKMGLNLSQNIDFKGSC